MIQLFRLNFISPPRHLVTWSLMASTFIHTGQCGNQIAGTFWQLVSNEQHQTQSQYSYLLPLLNIKNHKANCLMIDSEPKVVMDNIVKLRRIFDVNSSACIDSCGRANNWAMGYFSCFPPLPHSVPKPRKAKKKQFTTNSIPVAPPPQKLFNDAKYKLRKKIEVLSEASEPCAQLLASARGTKLTHPIHFAHSLPPSPLKMRLASLGAGR